MTLRGRRFIALSAFGAILSGCEPVAVTVSQGISDMTAMCLVYAEPATEAQ
jgi:hypothetical protein